MTRRHRLYPLPAGLRAFRAVRAALRRAGSERAPDLAERRIEDPATAGPEAARRDEAERRARRDGRLLSRAVEDLGEVFVLWDRDERLVLGNRRFRQLCASAGCDHTPGIAFEAFLRGGLENGLFPVPVDRREAWLEARLQRFRQPGGTFEEQRPDGTWYQIYYRKLEDGGTVALVADVTRRKRAELALVEAHELLEGAIGSIADGFALFGPDDRLVMCNARYRELSEPIADLICPGVGFEDLARAYLVRGHVWLGEEQEPGSWLAERIARHRRPGGKFEMQRSNNWVRIQESRMPNGGIVVVLTDISAQKRQEEQLRQVLRMEAVGKLTGGVAHDFNNLLAIIQGNLELVGEEVDDAQLRGLLESALRATGRGAELVQRLLAFGRRQTLRPEPTDLGRLIGELTGMMRRTLDATIEIDVELAEDLATVTIDRGQLENALINLVLNARDAMPEGGRLGIEARNVEIGEAGRARSSGAAPGRYVLLAVRDSGSGMAPDTRAQAFEPFFTTKETGRGSGLGLSMVYGFVKQSEGHIELSSTLGAGTEVLLYLPVGAARDAVEPVDQPLTSPRGRGETVLLVEDDVEVRNLAARLLRDLGYRVLEAADGESARLILADSERVDLLLSDVVLPGGVSGPDLVLEALSRDPGLKAAFMSGYAGADLDRAGALGSGVPLIAKPFRRGVFARLVRDALDAATPAHSGPPR